MLPRTFPSLNYTRPFDRTPITISWRTLNAVMTYLISWIANLNQKLGGSRGEGHPRSTRNP